MSRRDQIAEELRVAQGDDPEFPCGWCGGDDEHSTHCPSWVPTPSADAPEQQDDCPTPGCAGDSRYAAPGRGHRAGCRHPFDSPTRQDDDPDWLYNEASGALYAPWPGRPRMRKIIAFELDPALGHTIANTMNAASRRPAVATQ